MNMQYMKLFRGLLNTTVLNSLVIYRQNVGKNVDHPKFRNYFVEGLLVKYSVLCRASGHHNGGNIVKRLMHHHFSKRIPSAEEKCNSTR
jgi:hypothetical protein